MVICGICLGFGGGYRDATKIKTDKYDCDTPISNWLIGFGISYGFTFVWYIMQMCILSNKKERAKATVQCLSLFHFLINANF